MHFSPKVLLGLGLLALLILGYIAVDGLLFDGLKPRHIQTEAFQGDFYAPQGAFSEATVLMFGNGPQAYYWAKPFADRGWNTLALPYYRQPGLPPLMENIPLEYFEAALQWLQQQPEVDPGKIVLMGASRNAELALVIASTFPDLVHGVIAIAPSAVSWPNAVLPFNSDVLMPSWTYGGEAVPFIPMAKIKAPSTPMVETLPYWQAGLDQIDQYPAACIPVERIAGPILLLSGEDDQVWPSAEMSDMIEARLDSMDFAYPLENIQYPAAGHLISRGVDYLGERTGQMPIGDQSYSFAFGGTLDGDKLGHLDLKDRVFQFVEKIAQAN